MWKNETLEVLMVWDGLEFLGEAFFGVGEAKNLGKSRKELRQVRIVGVYSSSGHSRCCS